MSYSYADQLTLIKQIDMSEGQSRSLDCPFCGGRKKFSISKTDDGVTIWNCYRASCPVKGNFKGRRTTSSIRRSLDKVVQAAKFAPIVPDKKVTPLPIITKNLRNDPDALKFVTDNNCLEAYDNGYINIRYAPAEKRLMFYGNEGKGAVGRSLVGHKAKWWVYGDVSTGIHVGVGDTAVIVEDTPSACAVSRLDNYVGVALLGTNITEQIRNTLKYYANLYIVLDNDASVKAISLARSLSTTTKVRLTKHDLKYLSIEQIREVLKSPL
jgi:hypothetical protein